VGRIEEEFSFLEYAASYRISQALGVYTHPAPFLLTDEEKMNRPHQLLKDFSSSGSMFFKLLDGEEARVRFISFEKVPNNFDGGKTSLIRYHLEVEGEKKLWDRPSRKLAEQMAEIPLDSLISIKRTGQKNQTKYFITIIKE